MIRNFILTVIFILHTSICLYAANSDLINWHDSLDEALGEALFLDIPIMINISTDFRDLDKNVFSKPKFVEETIHFVALKLNGNSIAEANKLNKRYGITENQYTLYIDPTTMEVLSRIEGEYSQSSFLSSMKKAVATKSILEDIKTADKPTIEAIDFYIDQNDANTAYKILLNAINGGAYSIHKNWSKHTLNEKERVKYFNKIADIYTKHYNDLNKAAFTYLSLIKHCPNERDQIINADTKILDIYHKLNNEDKIINHINQILSRPNTPMKYKEYYLDIVLEIELRE